MPRILLMLMILSPWLAPAEVRQANAGHLPSADREGQRERILLWQPSPQHAVMTLPLLDDEQPEYAIEQYLLVVENDGTLRPLIPTERLREIRSQWKFRVYSPEALERPRVLIIANRKADHAGRRSRILRFSNLMNQGGFDSWLSPIGSTVRLSYERAQSYLKLRSQIIAAQIHLGGVDVDPSFYCELNEGSRPVSATQDELEGIEFEAYMHFGSGPVLGVCRGAQRIAVALGYKLTQHIPDSAPSVIEHRGHTQHSVRVIHPDLLRVFAGRHEVMVNSSHHQSVVWRPGGPLQIGAVSPDGIVEMLVGERLFLNQSHPERWDRSGSGKLYVSAFTEAARDRCGHLLRLISN